MSWFRLQCHETQVLSGYLNKQLFQLAEHSGKRAKVTDTLMNLETAGVKTKKNPDTGTLWNMLETSEITAFYFYFI